MEVFDKIITAINPKAGLRRMAARVAIGRLQEAERKFEAAAKSRRTNGWSSNNLSANAENGPQLQILRARSRDLVRNNPYAFNAIDVLVTNTIGTGIRASITSISDADSKAAKKIWKAWAEKTICDFDGDLDFYGLQALIFRSMAESGECLIIRRKMSSKDGGPLPIKLQVLEPDFIDISRDTLGISSGNYIQDGIEYNKMGQRVAYWLYDKHPGDEFTYSTSRRIPAEDVIHVYRKLRPGQQHGIPWGVASFLRLHDLDDYEDAQLMRQKIAACFAAFIQDADSDAVTSTTDDTDVSEKIQPGIIEHLPSGKTITFANPPTTQGYEAYTKKILQGISIGYGLSYEALSSDLSNVNFSSGRMGWLELQRKITEWQLNVVIPKVCEGVWSWFLEAMSMKYGINTERLENSWTVPRREMIDVLKETQATIKKIRAGLISWSEAVRELGYNPEELMAEIVADMDKIKKAGLTIESDASIPESTGTLKTAPKQA